MNALPVIVRELRAEARNPATFNLRLGGATILLGLLAFFWLTTAFRPGIGDLLFARLHLALHLAIWLLVPPLAADCISRERRENTLGLLLLTPLSAFDIVLAKGLVHGWRALMLWLAVLPVLAIPLLLGGVSWIVAVTSVIVNFSALCWALSAGLLASAFSKARSQALGLAALLAFGAFLCFGYCTGLSLFGTLAGGRGFHWAEAAVRGIALNLQVAVDWSYYQRIPAGAGRGFISGQILWITGKVAGLSLVALVSATLIAARAIRWNWQDKPPGPGYRWFLRVFCEPFVWRAFFKRWIRRKLERNPIGWLEQRTWTGRTAVAVWLAIVASFYIAMLNDTGYYRRFNSGVQFSMGLVLAVAMATVAAGSFRRERDLGVMELLLITPLREAELARGRLLGVWEQFLPAIGLLLSVWLWIALSFGERQDWELIVFWVATFISLPVAGLYYSLKQRGTIGALIWTLWTPLLWPLGLAVTGRMLGEFTARFGSPIPEGWVPVWLLPILWQAGWTARNWRRLKATLIARDFPMEVQ